MAATTQSLIIPSRIVGVCVCTESGYCFDKACDIKQEKELNLIDQATCHVDTYIPCSIKNYRASAQIRTDRLSLKVVHHMEIG